MSDRPRDPFVFVVGCPRSGTTLLQRMLDHHPDLAVANDTHFVARALEKTSPRLVERAIAGDPIPLDDPLLESMRGYRRFPRLGVDEADFDRLASLSRDYRELVGRLYRRFAESQGKRLGGEKTPDFVRKLPLLAGAFPDSRFVHIVRDGRDVALSTRDWATSQKGPGKWDLWSDDPIAACALWWSWQVGTGRRDGARLGGRYLEVSYEQLVAHPEEGLREIATFLELPYSDRMLAYHVGRQTAKPNGSAKSNWLPPTAGLRDWRQQMAPEELQMFEALAGDCLEATGRRLAAQPPTPAVEDRASCHREWWARFLERRARKERRRRATPDSGLAAPGAH